MKKVVCLRKRYNRCILTVVFIGTVLCSACVKHAEDGQLLILESSAEERAREAAGNAEGSVRLEDDYYEYMNGKVLADKIIPADSNSWSHFYELGEETYQILNQVLINAVENRENQKSGSLEQKIADLYLTAMDEDGRRAVKLGELQTYLDSIGQASSISEYLHAVAQIEGECGLYSIIAATPAVDMKDSSRYTGAIVGSDLGPGKETLEDKTQTEWIDEYLTYIEETLILGGVMDGEEAKAASEALLELQMQLAGHSLTIEKSMDPEVTYNLYSKEKLQELLSNIDIDLFLKDTNMSHFSSFNVYDVEAAKKVNEYLAEEHLELLKNYSSFCLLNDFAVYLSPELEKNKLSWINYQYGIQEQKTKEKICSELVQNNLSFEFGRLYVEQCFSEEDKQAVTDMIHEIISAYEEKIDRLNWMSVETKTSAKRKLRSLVVKVGYPDIWPDTFDEVQIISVENGGYLVNNVLALKKASYKELMTDSKKPVDRNEWGMTPQTVNAYYNRENNEIVFPAAILQAPFYEKHADAAANMGGIGTVIAHEISHAFDSGGALYDENGNFNIWWSETDLEKFNDRTQQVVKYYNSQEGFKGRMVNGSLTLTENIADLGALSCVTAVIGEDSDKLRLLFEQYATIWCSKYTDESMTKRLNNDVHSPAKVRVNAVLRNLDAFYLAYPEIKEGDKMYLAPGKRVKVW